MKKIYLSGVLLFLFAVVGPAIAQTSTGTTTNSINKRPILNAVKEVRDEREDFKANTVKPIRQEIKNDIKTTNQEIKTERQTFIKNATTTLKAANKEDRPEIRTELKNQKEQLKADIEAKREVLKQEMEQKRDQLKAERKTFQEESRKKIARAVIERINKALNNLQEALNRIIDINSRIETRIAKLQEAGVDTTEAESALARAEEKASAALEAIEMAKATINETSSATSTDTLSFKAVLKTTEEAVKAAREATSHTIGLVKGLGPKTATTTPENN